MEQRLEPVELVPVDEDHAAERGAVDGPRSVEDAGAEPLGDRPLHLVVVAQQPVDDLVARRDRRAVPLECRERLRFPGADSAGDRDG